MNVVCETEFIYFQWFPMILFPVVAALTYSTSEQYPRSCFFMLARRRAARAGLPQPLTPAINLFYPYLAVVLFSACLANQRNEWFYFAVCAVIAAALWSTRPRRFSTLVWIVALILVMMHRDAGPTPTGAVVGPPSLDASAAASVHAFDRPRLHGLRFAVGIAPERHVRDHPPQCARCRRSRGPGGGGGTGDDGADGYVLGRSLRETG